MKQQGVKIQGVKLNSPIENKKEVSLPIANEQSASPVTRALPSNIPTRANTSTNMAVGQPAPTSNVNLPSTAIRTPSVAIEGEGDVKEKKSIFSIFNIFRKKETYTNEDRAKHVCEFYNSVIKGDVNSLHMSFLGCDDDYMTAHYQGSYKESMVLVEFPMDLTASHLKSNLADIVAELDFTENFLTDFYGQNSVSLVSYQLIFNKALNTFTKKVTVLLNNQERSFSNDGTVPFISSVKTFVSAEMKSVTGLLTGRGDQFTIDHCDLNALLKNNRGKRIRVEILD